VDYGLSAIIAGKTSKFHIFALHHARFPLSYAMCFRPVARPGILATGCILFGEMNKKGGTGYGY